MKKFKCRGLQSNKRGSCFLAVLSHDLGSTVFTVEKLVPVTKAFIEPTSVTFVRCCSV